MIDTAIELTVGQLPSGLSPTTMAASEAVSQQLATSEWLGPLAPIAISPFFGLTVLSGIATYGPDWLQERSALFGAGSALNSPGLFWTMLLLAILTSLPRFTKLSKPLALAAENIEAYSAIIILVVVRFMGVSNGDASVAEPLVQGVMPPMQSAGIASLPIDFMMSIAAILNVIVINAVKLFFEFMVWLVPFPSIDALLEAGNKALCAGLIGVYCYSPLLATVLNLVLLVVCLLVFGWVHRRLVYYRDIIAGPILARLIPNWFAQRGDTIRAYCDQPLDGLPRYSCVRIRQITPNCFEVSGRWMWRSVHLRLEPCQANRNAGFFCTRLDLVHGDGTCHFFVHRKWVKSDNCFEPSSETREPALFVAQ